MLFIWTVGWNTLFIKNSKGSQTFEINPIDFVINTGTNHHDEYDNIKGKVLHIDIKTFNKFFDDDEMHFHVHVIAVNDNDTTPYYMEHDRSKSIFYSYGDKLFYHIISDSFSGPNLRFELIASNSSATDNLLLPNITEAFNASEDPKDIDLEGSWNKIFFHTYIDSHTLEESMMFYCVKRDQIEQYHFKIDYINSDKSGHIKSSLSDAHNK